MTLRITQLGFRDFRSYESLLLDDIGTLTIFVGPNAVGKTNIVEGVQLMTALSSFRHSTIDQLVRKGAASSGIKTTVRDERRLLDMSLHMEGHTRLYRLNGKRKKASELKGLIPSVTFTPDDLSLVKGSMRIRRLALDSLGSQLNANYYLIEKDYEKVIRHKNRLLKDEAGDDLLDSIDELLVTCGAQLMCYRIALLNRLTPFVKQRYEALAAGCERLGVWFAPSWSRDDAGLEKAYDPDRSWARENIQKALQEQRAEERARKRCIIGPHADCIGFTIDGMDATVYASQGQQRSIVLAYKLSEAAVIEDMLGQKPILLLDDVMSELDAQRRQALVDYIAQDVQTFITTANLNYFEEGMLSKASVVQLPLDEKPPISAILKESGTAEQAAEV